MWASSTITISGQARLNSSTWRGDLMKSVDTTTRMAIEEGFIGTAVALQPSHRGREHQFRLDVELVTQLSPPLLGQSRWAEDGQALNLASSQQLLGDQPRFDGFADTHVVGDEDTH